MSSVTVSERVVKAGDKYVVDLRGLICPYPQLYTARVIKNVEKGAVLEIMVDYPQSCQTIPALAPKLNFSVLDIIEANGYWIIRVKKN